MLLKLLTENLALGQMRKRPPVTVEHVDCVPARETLQDDHVLRGEAVDEAPLSYVDLFWPAALPQRSLSRDLSKANR
jgi:hypothetical protein